MVSYYKQNMDLYYFSSIIKMGEATNDENVAL